MGKKAAADGEKGGKKKIVMIVVPLLVVAGAAKMTVLKGKADAKGAAKPAAPVEGEVVDVGSLTVNLADHDRHYARVGIALVLNATTKSEEVVNKVPLLKDEAITKIGAHTSPELRTGEGQEMLRKELMEAANHVWEGDAVLRVALTELLVQ
jgi:flagellar protein FliL